MKIGVPREVKNHEYRVALTPSGVVEFVRRGHEVFVQRDAGEGSSIPDEAYEAVGARMLNSADDVWAEGDLILKVKEPIESEYHRMREKQVLFTYLHLAASKTCTEALLEKKVTGIAYETVELSDHSLPLLAPMSEVAGRLSVQAAAHFLMRAPGGRGVLMGGVPGVYPADVCIIGGGVSGLNAASTAVGMGARVTLLDKNIDRLRYIDQLFQGRLTTVASNKLELEKAVHASDVVIGAVLVPGARAPRLVSNDDIAQMRSGSVLVDISIDQGGCFEDSLPTTYDDPVYRVHDSLLYCVANMPGAVPNTSTYALTNVTLPYALSLASQGWREALQEDAALAKGLNTYDGRVTYEPVAEAHGLPWTRLTDVLAG